MNENGNKKNVPMNVLNQKLQQQEFIRMCKECGCKHSKFFTRAARSYTSKNLTSKERKRQVLSDLGEFHISGTLPEYVIRLLRDIAAIKVQEQNAHRSVRSKPLQYLRPSYTNMRW